MTRDQKLPAAPDGEQGKDPFLVKARQASRRAAAAAASEDPPPLRWELLARPRVERARLVSRIAVVLPLLLVGGSAGTWALVRHLEQPADSQIRPAATPATPSVTEPPTPQPPKRTAVVERAAPPAPPPRRRARARRRPDARTAAANVAADAGADQQPREVVVLPGRVTGDDEVIIVAPKAKMKPLWTVEGFKRRGMKGFMKKVDPVKPAPEGVEHEVP